MIDYQSSPPPSNGKKNNGLRLLPHRNFSVFNSTTSTVGDEYFFLILFIIVNIGNELLQRLVVKRYKFGIAVQEVCRTEGEEALVVVVVI